jgi:DNA-binding transcriptional ArsR family regulator
VASRFAVTQPAISQHLKVLKASGLVNERRDGTKRLYSVRPEGFGDLHGFLADVMPDRLETLKRVVERDHQSRSGHARRN